MVQTPVRSLTFEEFLEACPADGKRYELIDGQIIELMATREHDDIAEFLQLAMQVEKNRLKLNYRITTKATVKTLRADGEIRGRTPDVSVVDKAIWDSEPKSYSAMDKALQLAVEVVSPGNLHEDYLHKLAEYELKGIPEYWIVDHLAVGASRYIGSPKQPTILIFTLVDGEYQVATYRGDDALISATFPELRLTAAQVFNPDL